MIAPSTQPFPVARLPRLDRMDLALLQGDGPEIWLQTVEPVARSLARRLTAGRLFIRPERRAVLWPEELRAAFPGRWRFGVFCEPLGNRCGFLAIDPVLAGKVMARIDRERTRIRGELDWSLGTSGRIGFLMCAALAELSHHQDGYREWRYAGLSESSAELGRMCRKEDRFRADWLQVRMAGEHGFAAWIEPEASIASRGATCAVAPRSIPHRLASLPVTIEEVVGEVELPAYQVAVLSVGDVLLFGPEPPAGRRRVRLAGLELGLGAAPGGGWRLETMKTARGEPWMKDHPARQVDAPCGIDSERLPILLTIEAGRLEVEAGQVAGLRVGDVLELPDAVLGPVDVRAGSRLLARGELVQIDDRRGVRLLDIGGAEEPGYEQET